MPSTPFVNSVFFTQTLICNISASSTLLVDVVPPVRSISGVKSLLRFFLLVGLFFIVTTRVVTSIVNNPFDVSSVKSTVSYQRTVYEATATPEPEASPETSKLSNDSASLCNLHGVKRIEVRRIHRERRGADFVRKGQQERPRVARFSRELRVRR